MRPSLAAVGAYVIQDVLKSGDPDFRMLAQPIQELLMSFGGDFEIIAAGAVELQYTEAARVPDPLGVGDELFAVRLVDRPPTGDAEKIQRAWIGDHGLVLIAAGTHVFHEARATQAFGVVDTAHHRLTARHGIGAVARAVDAEEYVIHDADLAEHPVDVVIFG